MKQSIASCLDAQIEETGRRIAEIEAEIIRYSESQSDQAIAADGAGRMQLEPQLANYSQ
jgi:hypothetical protein